MNSTNPRVFVLIGALKRARETMGWTQKTLAENSGVSIGLVGLIETGDRQPGYGNALAIAEALNCPLDAFALVLTPQTTTKLRTLLEVAA